MNLQALSEDELKKNRAADMLIIDIRSSMEYAAEHIPGSLNIPLEKISSTDFSPWKDKSILFHCKAGMRTERAKEILCQVGARSLHCLPGGIEQWKHCGLATEKNKNAPIDIIRQVHITAGSLILISLILSFWLSAYFFIFTAFIGAGLLFAGLTGFCGMARILMCLPWNKIHKGGKNDDKTV